MSAKTIGQEKTGHAGNRPKDAVMIRRHFIEYRPGPLWVDGKVLKHRHTVSGMNENLLDERGFKVCLIARRFVGIIPCQQEPTAFGTEMEPRPHVDDHGRGMRKV